MDIVEQLRKSANTVNEQDGYTFRLGLQKEAADEIERLQKQAHYHYENGLKKDVEIERLQAALRAALQQNEE